MAADGVRIVGIAGSLRRGSYNAALLRAAAELAPAGVEIAEGSIRGIPLYDGDLEAAEGLPATVVALKEAIVAADGLLLVTPEYNNGIPGPFKNAIDWLSRPASDVGRVFGGRPVGLIGASPGGFGTVMAQAAWQPVLRFLGADAWWGRRLMVSRAGAAFEDGRLASEEMRGQLAAYLEGFAAHVRAVRRR
jgi:NAD(P)H-dependent FMN reductase